MIKLERIHLKNYKNIAEADLTLGQLNVIVGENNAGKTNLLEVIPLLNHIINGSINDVMQGFAYSGKFRNFGQISSFKKGHNLIGPMEILTIELEFSDSTKGIIYNYKIELESVYPGNEVLLGPIKIINELFTYKNRTITGKASTIFKRTENSIEYGKGIKKDDIISQLEPHISVLRLLSIIYGSKNVSSEYKEAIDALRYILTSYIFYFSPHLLKERELKYENKNRIAQYDLIAEIEQLQNDENWDEYLKTLKVILNIREVVLTGGFKIPNNPVSLKKEVHFFQGKLPKGIGDLSDGSVILLALITKLFSDPSDIFLIEEPENSIHPRALSELMKLIRNRSLDKQFIITTHSSYLLNMIKPEEVFVASIQKDGTSKIGALPDVKAIKKKLAKGFMDFGNIVFDEAAND